MSANCKEDDHGLHFMFDHGRGDTVIGWVIADYTLALIVDMCRTNFGPALTLESISLRRPLPENPAPYEDFFCCPVCFGAAIDGFVLARHIADRSLSTSNHELATTFDAILTEQLAEVSSSDLVHRCRAHLLQELTSGEPSEEELAKALGMSRRTLQRKLGDLGLTYKGVLEKTRYDLALRYLDDPTKSVTDVTFLLGFSEQSAFSRAFKRWNGNAPTAYRLERAMLA